MQHSDLIDKLSLIYPSVLLIIMFGCCVQLAVFMIITERRIKREGREKKDDLQSYYENISKPAPMEEAGKSM